MSILFGDSAYPLSNYPSGVSGWSIYIGGDTPHVWTNSDIAGIPSRIPYRLPIFTRDNPQSNNVNIDSAAAIAGLLRIGAPKGCTLGLDFETAVDAAYVTAFNDNLGTAGYKVLIYGSQSYVLQNPTPSAGYWGADWTGIAQILPGDVMTQYSSNSSFDLSITDHPELFWNIQTGGVGPAAPPAPPKTSRLEQNMLIWGPSGTVYLLSGGKLHPIDNPVSLAQYEKLGLPSLQGIDAQEEANLNRDFPPR